MPLCCYVQVSVTWHSLSTRQLCALEKALEKALDSTSQKQNCEIEGGGWQAMVSEYDNKTDLPRRDKEDSLLCERLRLESFIEREI